MKILLLEDDTLLGELLQEHLRDGGHEVTWLTDGDAAEEAILQNRYDLLLLDVHVPGIDGFELLESMRHRDDTTPVVMITSRNTSGDVKEGFELGCDDYIKKPFEFEELDARIAHVAKVHGIGDQERIELGEELWFVPSRHRLVAKNETYNLTPKASEILHYLWRHRGRIVSREELVQNIWPYDETPSDATLRSHIKTLRKHIPGIVTERGVGYGFESS